MTSPRRPKSALNPDPGLREAHDIATAISGILEDSATATALHRAEEDALLRRVGLPDDERALSTLSLSARGRRIDQDREHHIRLIRLAILHEEEGLARYRYAIATGEAEAGQASAKAFDEAYACWRAIATLPGSDETIAPGRILSPAVGARMLAEALPERPLSGELSLALHLAVCGVLAKRPADVRLDLIAFELTPVESTSWPEVVASRITAAFTLLVRKDGGWTDVANSLRHIEALRSLQQSLEGDYLAGAEGTLGQRHAALGLVGFYHLAQLVVTAGEYLRTGEPALEAVSTRIDRHRERARELFDATGRAVWAHAAELLWAGTRELAQASIWSHVSALGELTGRFVQTLTAAGNERPVLELWLSQQHALRHNVLSAYHRAILVEMPTSAGKTLLAKFSIVQTKALHPEGRIVYLVPTRALVNQITLELRRDFRGVGISVEQAVPVFELDPTEDTLLAGGCDVLVTTPEKFDLLLRKGHPITDRLALVVADEAHTLADEGRGARLELLLGTIKRERAGARFLLLSPFVPRANELATWLGDERALTPIEVRWEPSSKLVGITHNAGRSWKRSLLFETVSAASSPAVTPGRTVSLGSASEGTSKKGVSEATAIALRNRGPVLIICRGRGTAAKRASALAGQPSTRSARQLDPETSATIEAVCRYIEDETGAPSPLAEHLRKGVAFHHAGLSSESRFLIEHLIRIGAVDVVCGTTTLAAGVNFPISSVVVETLNKGPVRLSYSDFWNIAGRAGRALVDSVGVIAFPVATPKQRDDVKAFLQREAQEISSDLMKSIEALGDAALRFDMGLVENHPTIGAFLQFVAHAMRVAGSGAIASQVDELLRSTLGYRQALRRDPSGTLAKRLIRVARQYVEQTRQHERLLPLADATGFATPSVLYLQAQLAFMPEARQARSWAPDVLFGSDLTSLTAKVHAVAEVPEIKLGMEGGGPFSARRIAEILRDWVAGATIVSLADRYGARAEPISDEDDNIDETGVDRADTTTEFAKYLFGDLLTRASWGLGAYESLCLAGQERSGDEAYVPSLIYFGVRQPTAVWLRMVGVPRIAADRLANQWKAERRADPDSYTSIREWVNSRTDTQLRESLPAASRMQASDFRRVWATLSGEG